MFRRSLLALALLAPAALAQQPDTDLYYVVFLRPDPARQPLEKAEGERMQAAHMANIRTMAADGILVSAGPFADTPATISGIFIMQAPSLDEAKRIAEKDPTVRGRRNTVDVHAWRGPAGIGVEYRRLHKENPATPEGMAERPLALIFRGAAWSPQAPRAAEFLTPLRGQLSAAGNVEGAEDLAGLAVFRPGSFEEARQLLDAQAAVKNSVFRVEYHRWWCSAHVLPWESVN